MKKILIVIVLVTAIGLFISTSPKAKNTINTAKLSFATIQSDISSNGAYLIDVRTPSEYATGHFPGAINFDSTKVEAGQFPKLAKNAHIYLYCHSGRRASMVETAMKKSGFTNVTSLGGIADIQTIGGKLTE